jgi:hypothetical protein
MWWRQVVSVSAVASDVCDLGIVRSAAPDVY